MTSRSTALVTGASSGIGRALAAQLAAKGHDLVLVARREDALRAVAAEVGTQHGAHALVVPADLSVPGASEHVVGAVRDAGVAVDVLVNNAATVTFGEFDQLELHQERSMLQLNVTTPVELTHHFFGQMKARRSGTILFLSGAMVYLPMPYYTTYRATKAFLATFAEGLRLEGQRYGVDVVTLFPWLTNTDFQKPLGFDVEQMGVPFYRTPEDVAASALACIGRKAVVRDGGANRVVYTLTRVLPESVLTKMIKPPRVPEQTPASSAPS